MYLFLETERLKIQPLELRDYAFIFKLVNTDAWINNIGDRKVRNLADAKAYIQKIQNNPKYYCHTFRSRKSGELIGIVTFIYRETQKFPDIGYAMLPPFEGKGLAYEAVKSYLGKLKDEKVTDRIIAITDASNKRSIALLDRLAFSRADNLCENNSEIFIRSLL